MNLYGYVRSAPLNLTDPHGTFPKSPAEAMECIEGNPKYMFSFYNHNINKNNATIAELSSKLNQITGGPTCEVNKERDAITKRIRYLQKLNANYQIEWDKLSSQCSYFYKGGYTPIK